MTITMANQTLGKFLQDEMRRRDMSNRQFAAFIDISPQVINKFVDYGEKDVGYPSMEFLVKLAKATDIDLATIVAMVEPDATNINTDVRLIAERIEKLPPDQRDAVDAFILALNLKSGNKK